MQEVLMRCSCEFTSSNIIEDNFSCRGSQGQFRNTVVYRAMIILQVPDTITDADDIVSNINQWVQTEPSVIIEGITLALDPGCPAVLDSFDSNDCESPSDQANPSSSSSLPIAIIIGVAVAVVVIILLLIIAAIAIVVYRRHKATYRYYKMISLLIVLLSVMSYVCYQWHGQMLGHSWACLCKAC